MLHLFLLASVVIGCWYVFKPAGTRDSFYSIAVRVFTPLAAFALAIFTLIKGEWPIALPLFILSIILSGVLTKFGSGGNAGNRQAYANGKVLVLMYDLAQRPYDGYIMRGSLSGRKLSSLSIGELRSFWLRLESDAASRSLLEAYLNRRFAGWRENFQNYAASRQGGNGSSGAMSKQEAYKILGVKPGASTSEIRKAHRTLMKEIHPDKGGTAAMAARANEARDVLLEGH